MSTASPRLDSREAWVVAAVSFLLNAIALGATILIIVSLKEIAVTEGWPREAPSLVYAATITGTGIGGIIMGWWSDRKGVRWPVTLGAFGIGLGSILASQASEAWQMALAGMFLIGGCGTSAFFAVLIANATRWFVRRRGLAVAFVAAGQNLAGSLWPPAFGVIGAAGGWRTSFMVFGLFVFVTVLPLTLFLRQRAPVASTASHAHGAAPPVLGMPANAVHAILFVMQVLCCLAMAAPFVHGPAHVSDLGHSMALGATMLTVILTVSLASLLTLGYIADRIGGLRTLTIASAIQAVALVLYANFESLPTLYASAVVFGLGFGGLVPSYAIVIRELFPAHQVGWRIASTFLGGTLGMAGGGWLAGRIFDSMGHYHMAFYMGLVFNLANLALAGFLLRRWLGVHGGGLREALRRV